LVQENRGGGAFTQQKHSIALIVADSLISDQPEVEIGVGSCYIQQMRGKVVVT
jgi:hypothetical protein